MSVGVEVIARPCHAAEYVAANGGDWISTHEVITDRASAARRGRVAMVLLVYCRRVQERVFLVVEGRIAYRPRSVSSCWMVSQRCSLSARQRWRR